jgi:hypothetical protein
MEEKKYKLCLKYIIKMEIKLILIIIIKNIMDIQIIIKYMMDIVHKYNHIVQ